MCPRCRGELTPTELSSGQRAAALEPALACGPCRLAYPIVDGVPWMLEELARPRTG